MPRTRAVGGLPLQNEAMSSDSELGFFADLDRLLAGGSPAAAGPVWDDVLTLALRRLDCVTGSIHVLDAGDGLLHLRASRGIPPQILPQVERIAIGKGMAGLAAERRQPVGACNLQTDASGDVRPGAKLTQMKGSLCVPMLDGTELRGTFGVARPDEHEFDTGETALVMAVGERIARALG